MKRGMGWKRKDGGEQTCEEARIGTLELVGCGFELYLCYMLELCDIRQIIFILSLTFAILIRSVFISYLPYNVCVSIKQVMYGKFLHIVGSVYIELFLSLSFNNIIKNTTF